MRGNNTKRRTVLFPSFLILQKKSYGRRRIGVPEAASPYMGESRSAEWCHAVLFTGIIIFRQRRKRIRMMKRKRVSTSPQYEGR